MAAAGTSTWPRRSVAASHAATTMPTLLRRGARSSRSTMSRGMTRQRFSTGAVFGCRQRRNGRRRCAEACSSTATRRRRCRTRSRSGSIRGATKRQTPAAHGAATVTAMQTSLPSCRRWAALRSSPAPMARATSSATRPSGRSIGMRLHSTRASTAIAWFAAARSWIRPPAAMPSPARHSLPFKRSSITGFRGLRDTRTK